MMSNTPLGENTLYVQRMFSITEGSEEVRNFGVLADRVRKVGATRIDRRNLNRSKDAFTAKYLPKALAMGKGYIDGVYKALPTDSKTSGRTSKLEEYAQAQKNNRAKKWSYDNFKGDLEKLSEMPSSSYAKDSALNSMYDADQKAMTEDGNYRTKYYYEGSVPYDFEYLKSPEFKQRANDALNVLKMQRDKAYDKVKDIKRRLPSSWTK